MERTIDTDEIYKILRSRIINLEYEPAQVLNEEDIAKEFNVSRTPIRKIFQQLNNDKLLNIIPRFGAQVAPLDFKYMKSVFEVTRELDPFAARLAVDRISKEQLEELEEILERMKTYKISEDYQRAIKDDERFHDIIFLSSGNQCLAEILAGLHLHTERLWHYCEQYFESMEFFTNTLGKILDSIKEKNYEAVEKYSRKHIDDFVEKIRNQML